MRHIPVPHPCGPARALFKFAPGKFVDGQGRYDPITTLRLTTGFVNSLPLLIAACLWLLTMSGTARAATPTLSFDQLYASYSVLGLEFSQPVKTLAGQRVKMRGFMAPPLKAEAQFFVLTKMPMALCPFCSSDADWPEDIVVVYLAKRQTFVQNNTQIDVEGVLEYGSWTDPETGFVSLLRLRDAHFETR